MTVSQISRGDVHNELLVRFEPRRRFDGGIQPLNVWTGGEDRQFDVDGVSRTYQGGGSLLSVDPIRYAADLSVQTQQIQLSGVSVDVDELIREYDARQALVEIHAARFNPESGILLGVDRVFRGTVDEINWSTEGVGADESVETSATLTLVSASRGLTRPLTSKRSDASQSRRSGDRWFRYADVGLVETQWTITDPGR